MFIIIFILVYIYLYIYIYKLSSLFLGERDLCRLQTCMIRKKGCVADTVAVSPVVTLVALTRMVSHGSASFQIEMCASNGGCFYLREPSSLEGCNLRTWHEFPI